jgi:N-acetylmuramoyl-L-alanine amidase
VPPITRCVSILHLVRATFAIGSKDRGLYKYTVGNQIDLSSASVLQTEFQRKGFSGAFVVAFKNGKRIPVGEAKKLLN